MTYFLIGLVLGYLIGKSRGYDLCFQHLHRKYGWGEPWIPGA